MSLVVVRKLSYSVVCGNLSSPCAQSLSYVWLFVTPWTVACQAPLSIGLSQQVYWSGLPFPPAENLPEPGTEPMSPVSGIDRQILYHGVTWEVFSYPVQFSSVAQLCPTLCDPMDCSMPGLPVHHQLPVFTQTHVHCQWCHPTISSSVVPFSCPQSFPAPGSFQMSQLFALGG